MPVGDVGAYNVNAAMLGQPTQQTQNDQADDVIAKLLKNRGAKDAQNKTADKTTSDKRTGEAQVRQGEQSKGQQMMKALSEGKGGPIAKQAAEILNGSPLGKIVNDKSKETFGEVTQKTPQAGFATAEAFSKVPAQGQPIASEALVVMSQASTQGEKALKEVEEQVGQFIKNASEGDVSPNAQKKMFGKAMKEPGGETGAALKQFFGAKGPDGKPLTKLMNGSAQETAANAFAKDPKKLGDAMKSLEQFAAKPGLLSNKMNAGDMKSNFSALSKVAIGAEKLGITMEAQEKIFSSTKFHGMSAQKRADMIAVIGKAPDNAGAVAQTLGKIRDTRTSKFIAGLKAEGTSSEALAKLEGACNKATIPFPPIGSAESNEERQRDPQKYLIGFKAKMMRAAHAVKKHNEGIAKKLPNAKTPGAIAKLDTPRTGFSSLIGNETTVEGVMNKLSCSKEEAQIVLDLHNGCMKDLGELDLNRKITVQKRMARGKKDARADLKEKRTSTTALPARQTITLTSEQQLESAVSFNNFVGKSSKTPTPAAGETSAAASAEAPAAASAEEVAARNTQAFRPAGKGGLKVGGTGMKQWGNNSFKVGMDNETRLKQLAQQKDTAKAALKNDATQLVKGPMIGKSSDIRGLADIVSNKVPWLQLTSAEKAVMRNMQVTANILESWYAGGNRLYSPLQAKMWDELKEIQQKSAMLLGIAQPNWDALAGQLSQSVKANAPLRGKQTIHNVSNVASKANA